MPVPQIEAYYESSNTSLHTLYSFSFLRYYKKKSSFISIISGLVVDDEIYTLFENSVIFLLFSSLNMGGYERVIIGV